MEQMNINQVEYKANNGKIIGAAEYFKQLNGDIAFLLPAPDSINYYEGLSTYNMKAMDIADEMLSDLETYAPYLRFIAQASRSSCCIMLTALKDMMRLTNKSYRSIDTCLGLLKLTDKRTAAKSRATKTEITAAVNKLKNGITGMRRLTSVNERKNLVEKAAKNGIRYAAGTDMLKLLYLTDLVGKYEKSDKIFLGDVLTEYNAQNTYRGVYKGRCGKGICTAEYLLYYQNKLFGNQAPKTITQHFKYKDNILSALKKIKDSLVSNTRRLSREEAYITADNYKRITNAAENLREFGLIVQLTKPEVHLAAAQVVV